MANVKGTPEILIPKDANPIRPDAKGNPTAYEKDGTVYYAPGHPDYEKGFRTEQERIKAQEKGFEYGANTGKLVPKESIIVEEKGGARYRVSARDFDSTKREGIIPRHIEAKIKRGEYTVPVEATSEKGEKAQLLVSKKETERIAALPERKQFDELQKIGIIRGNAVYKEKEGKGYAVIETVKPAKQAAKTIKGDRPNPSVTTKYETKKTTIQSALPYLQKLADNAPKVNSTTFAEDTKKYLKMYGDFFSDMAKSNIESYKEIATDKSLSLTEKARKIGLHTADLFVPGVWARNWGDYSPIEKGINIGLDLLVVLPIAKAAAPEVKTAVASMFKSAPKKELESALAKLETGLAKGNVNFIKQAGSEIKQVAKKVDVNGGSKALWERGALLERNADDIADFVRASADRQLSDKEIKLLKSSVKDQKKILKQVTSDTKVKSKALQETITEVTPYDPLSPPRLPHKLPNVPNLKVAHGGTITTIPLSAFNTMTKSQVAKLYGIGVAVITKAIATQLPDIAKTLDETPGTQPQVSDFPTEKIEPKPTPSGAPESGEEVAVTTIPIEDIMSQPLGGVSPSTEEKPAASTETLPSVETSPATESSPAPETEPETGTATTTPTKPAGKPPTVSTGKRNGFSKSMSNKEKREVIRTARGAIGWKQGNSVVVIIHPYKRSEHATIMNINRIPSIVGTTVRGAGSARKTAKLLYGILPTKRFMADLGAQDVTITPRGKSFDLSFTPDPKLQTTHEINISGNRKVFPLGNK